LAFISLDIPSSFDTSFFAPAPTTGFIGGVVQSPATHQTKLLDRYKVLHP